MEQIVPQIYQQCKIEGCMKLFHYSDQDSLLGYWKL